MDEAHVLQGRPWYMIGMLLITEEKIYIFKDNENSIMARPAKPANKDMSITPVYIFSNKK